MKITFLGTAHGVPEKDRYCSSILIQVGDKNYLIDAGAPIVDILTRMDITPDKITGIFITHMHGDHFNGLSDFVNIVAWYYTSASTKIFVPDENGVKALKAWDEFVDVERCDNIEIKMYEAGEVFDDGNIKVTAFKTQHTSASHAFMIETEGKRVIFTGDLRHPSVDMPAVCFEKNCDLVVCESAHFDISACNEVYDKMKMNRLIINHVAPSHSIKEYEQLEAKDHKYKLDLSYDGMTVNV